MSTTTLAQGINLPAETVIIVELDHPGAARSSTPYTVAEYKNIAGRAGWLGLTDRGRSILIVGGDVDSQRQWHRYVTAAPEDLRSQLLDVQQDLYTLLLRIVAVAARREGDEHLTEDDVMAFLAESFATHQQRLIGSADPFPSATAAATLAELQSADLLVSGTGGLELTELGRYVAQSGLQVSSAVRVARALRMVHPSQLNRATVITAAQLTDELSQVRIPVNSRGWRPEQQTFFGELRRHQIAEPILASLPAASSQTMGAA